MKKSVCVFCGSSLGEDRTFLSEAKTLGKYLAEHQIRLIYGGGDSGLMGAIAKSCMDHGGEVIGVIPKILYDMVSHFPLSELIIVDTMHERKQKMYELSNGFLAFPGGIGTLEELFETWTWKQIKVHQKPLAIVNINGYYNSLFTFLHEIVEKGFLSKEHLQAVQVYQSFNEAKFFLDDLTDNES